MEFSKFHLALIILVISLEAISPATSKDMRYHASDVKALNGFQSCLESPIEGWNESTSPDCCAWSGVTCSGNAKRVVGLELGSKRLSGNICESLAGLDQLKILNLSHNYFTGLVPGQFFRLYNLEVLDLSNNNLVGSPVASVCKVPNRLRVLNLSNNQFSGDIPDSLGNCTSLQVLSLYGNRLLGELPGSIFRLHNLSEVNLAGNDLSGLLSKGIENLSNLVKLDISLNHFFGSIPDSFMSLRKFENLAASSNKFTGYLPSSLINSPSLLMLNVNNNSLDGQISLNCSAMVSLVSLDLGSNSFRGSLPDSLSSCRRLISLNLSNNKFTGEVPKSYKRLKELSLFFISNAGINGLSTSLEILQHCKNLSVLVLTMNFYNEEMPSDPNFQFKNLKAFVLANSQLKGRIPTWLSGCTKLKLLDLSWNNLEGTIPLWVGTFEFLFYLDLSNNSLSREIPESLTRLRRLNKEHDFFEEPIPSFPVYTYREGGKGLKYKMLWNLRPSLLLGNNNLSGPIWPAFGNLKLLHVLNLKNNQLSGNIPSSFSGMEQLEILDLSQNKLYGSIPSLLLGLHFLSSFNVSFNMLSGEIPSGGQFDTFPWSSFMGNKGLWGRHYYSHSPEQSVSLDTNYYEQTDFKCVFGFGAVTGFLLSVVFCFTSGWVFRRVG